MEARIAIAWNRRSHESRNLMAVGIALKQGSLGGRYALNRIAWKKRRAGVVGKRGSSEYMETGVAWKWEFNGSGFA
jgi:hypothetical protein